MASLAGHAMPTTKRSRATAPAVVVLIAALVSRGWATAHDDTTAPSPDVTRSISVNQGAASRLVSGRISTSARDQLIVAFLASDGPAGAVQSFLSVTGCGLDWDLVERANAQLGTSEIWQATSQAPLAGCAVTAARARGAYEGTATLVAYDNAVVGNSAGASGDEDNAKVRISGREGSLLFAVGNDWDDAIARQMPAGQAIVHQFLSPKGDTMWVQRATQPMPITSTVTMGAAEPKGNRFNFAAVEIRAIPGTPAPAPAPSSTPAPASSSAPAPAPSSSSPPKPAATPTSPAATSSAPAAPAATTSAPAAPAATSSAPAAPAPSATSAPPPPNAPAEIVPVVGGVPGPGNTGVPEGTALQASGALTITTAGTVLDSLDISGGVLILAPNVTIKRSRIRGSGQYGVYTKGGSVTITDSEIIGFDNAIAFSNWQCIRCDISGQNQDGVKLGSNVRLEASYIHGLTPEAGAHADGAQMQGGETNLYVIGNSIDSSNGGSMGNAAIILKPDFGGSAPGPVVIEGNVLSGGNYTLMHVDSGDARQSGVTIRGNRFKRVATYGAAMANAPCTWSDNAYVDGQAIPSPCR